MTPLDRLKWFVATCGGFGYSPIFPGTAGALWGIAIYVPIAVFASEPLQTILIAAALFAVSAVTIQLAPWAETFFDEKDSGKFVTDEVAGFLLTVLLFRSSSVLLTVVWAFPITRIIDIVKIPPAKRLERWPAGWGVLADDLLGSLYAAGLLHVLAFFFPHWFS
jgi:phosphatidylglycerophosphatase A